jgi:hypothetical protein
MTGLLETNKMWLAVLLRNGCQVGLSQGICERRALDALQAIRYHVAGCVVTPTSPAGTLRRSSK